MPAEYLLRSAARVNYSTLCCTARRSGCGCARVARQTSTARARSEHRPADRRLPVRAQRSAG